MNTPKHEIMETRATRLDFIIVLDVGECYEFSTVEDTVKFIKELKTQNLFPSLTSRMNITVQCDWSADDFDYVFCAAGPVDGQEVHDADTAIQSIEEVISLLNYTWKHHEINPLVAGDVCATSSQRLYYACMCEGELKKLIDEQQELETESDEPPINTDRLLVMYPLHGYGMTNDDPMAQGA